MYSASLLPVLKVSLIFLFQGNSRVRLVQQVKEKVSKENAHSLSNHL